MENTKPKWEEEFDKLIPKGVDILHEIKSDKIFCSRQAVVNFISSLLTAQRKEVLDMIDEVTKGYKINTWVREEKDEWIADLVSEQVKKSIDTFLKDIKERILDK